MLDALSQFHSAIVNAGLNPPATLEPGKFHKFPGEGKRNSNTAAWCKLFPDGLGGIYGDYSTGLSTNWQAKREKPFTPAEREAFKRHVEEAKAEAEAERAAKQAEAAKKAVAIWEGAKDATASHPYLVRKQIKTYDGLRVRDGLLLVPMRDASGKLWNLERIAPEKPADGTDKKGLFGGRRTGCYYAIGSADDLKRLGLLCIAEGYATAASIHEATGYPVAVAFAAGNLLPVARALREKYPAVRLILCADDDYRTEGNPGIAKATEAARAVGGVLAVPDFGGERPEGATDFNDLANERGPEAVQRALANATAPAMLEHQPSIGNTPVGDPASHIVVVSLLDFVNREIRPRERILAPWLLTQSLNMVYAWRGVGKTHVALGIAFATASGGSFLKWKASQPQPVLFLDGEMPAISMQERLKGLVAGSAEDFDPDFFRLVTPDLQTGAMPDLATAEGQERIDEIIGDTKLIVIDNLSSLARSGGRENDAESWLPIQPWALRQRQQGRSVLFVHHSGKGGAQRGTSKREDILDTVISLKRPAEYNPADGAVFPPHRILVPLLNILPGDSVTDSWHEISDGPR